MGLHVVLREMDLLLLGLVNPLKITGLALAFGIPPGLLLALSRLTQFKLLSLLTTLIIEFFRTTPPLFKLFWFFFALLILIDVRLTP